MFCPRCSREQTSEEVRFCNGCGFRLVDVAEALRNDGLVERNVVSEARELKKNLTKALAVMTLSAVFFLLTFILGTPEPSYFVQFNMAVAILCFLFGLVWITHSFRRQPRQSPRRADEAGGHSDADEPRVLEGRRRESAPRLGEPDLSSLVGAGVRSRDNTKREDLSAARPSVTEGTTRLLEKDVEP